MRTVRPTACFLFSITLTLSLFGVGCSEDRHLFYSSVERPTNIALVDPLSDTPVWIKQVPVGQTLELDFDRGDENELQQVQNKPPTHLTWKLYGHSLKDDPLDEETLALPGTPLIIKVSYRPGPEYPPGSSPRLP